MDIKNIYELFLSCSTICTDTRKIVQGSMFVALKGDSFDGNDYAQEAIELGSKYAIVSKLPANADERFILVEDTLLALQSLAKYHREQFNIPVIGITGTNGKTTTKELVNIVLSTSFKTLCTEGNLNNHIGVPLTLLRLNKEHEIAVIEMGASHPGEISDLVNISQPNYGLITNVGEAHLEGFGSFEGVKKTKGELYEWLSIHKGLVFYNADNSHLVEMLANHKVKNKQPYGILFSGSKIGEVSAEKPTLSLLYNDKKGASRLIKTSMIGAYNADNVLAALTIGLHFGVDIDQAIAAVEAYSPSNSRSQLVKTEDNILIIDAYNANVDSMRVALKNFAETQFSNKVLILGDMLELGVYSEQAHKEILSLAKAITNEIFLVGKREFRNVAEPSDKVFTTSLELKEYFTENHLQGKTILIKGSNSNKLGILREVL